MAPSEYAVQRMTLADQAYHALRSSILNRRIEPGERLIVRELSETLELSPTPVKSALSSLAREGLVIHTPHQGFAVPELNRRDVGEIYQLREVVDGLAARLAAQADHPSVADDLGELLEAQRACAEDDLERYGDLDLAFHRKIWEASGNRRLLDMAANIQHQLRLLFSTSVMAPGRLSASIDEHAAIIDAIRAGSPDEAEAQMRAHTNRAGEALQSYLRRESNASASS
ncbi:MAG: GntR family transcriptional regulator [Candidatus Bipolaricaulia bacterium]